MGIGDSRAIYQDLQFARAERSTCKRTGDANGIRFWTDRIKILLLVRIGLIVDVVEYEHRCKDCNCVIWEQCCCETLEKCTLHPLCPSCWTRRTNPL